MAAEVHGVVRASLDADAAVALQVCEAQRLGADAGSWGLLGSVAGPRYQRVRSERPLWGRLALGGQKAPRTAFRLLAAALYDCYRPILLKNSVSRRERFSANWTSRARIASEFESSQT